jgi:hypothetical protein
VKFDQPIFEVFQESDGSRGNVIGYFRPSRAQPLVLARFEDGSPALVEARTGKGRVLLFTSSLGPSWNDLPLTPLYLPFIHQMVRYAGTREEMRGTAWANVYSQQAKRQRRRDRHAGGRDCRKRVTPDGDLLVTAREPGFYRLRYSSRRVRRRNI